MEFFEIFSSYIAIKEQSYFVENYIDILSITSTIYIGFIAFVYIKILDTKREIKESLNFILLKMYKKEYFLSLYLGINSFLLFFSVSSIILGNFLDDKSLNYIILVNLIFVLVDLFYNFFVSLLLEKYIFKKEKILKENFVIDYNINLNKRSNNVFDEKLVFIRSEILNEINSNNISIPYINQMLEEFKKILHSSENFLNKYYASRVSLNDLNLNYYYQVLYEIQYIFQQVIKNNNKNDLNYYFLDFIVSIFENLIKATDNIKIQDFYCNIVIDEIKVMYKILLKSNTNDINLGILFKIYTLLLSYSYKNFSFLYNLQDPNNLIFDIVKNIIDSDSKDKKEIMVVISKNLDSSFTFYSKEIKDRNYILCNVVKLNYSILSYLYFRNNYTLFKEYLRDYNSNSTIFCCPVFIDSINMIIQYSTDSSFKIFKNNEKFDSYISSEEYKICVLFFFFLNIYLTLKNYKQNIKFLLKNTNVKNIEYIKYKVNMLLNMDYIEQLHGKDIFYNIYNNDISDSILGKCFNNFFNNKDFLKLFILEQEINDIKNFTIKQFERIKRKIKEKRDKLISSDINSNLLLWTRDDFIKELQKYVNYINYDKIKIENIKYIDGEFLNISFEKYYFLTEDYKNKLHNIMIESNYYKIYNSIFDKCVKISNITELENIDLTDYIIINNFSSNAKNFKGIFIEDKYMKNIEDYISIKNIKIHNMDIPVCDIPNFHINPNNKNLYSILIIKKNSLKILKINSSILDNNVIFTEKSICCNDILEYCYNKDYKSNKKIIIKIPKIVSIKFYDNFIGYKIIIK